MAAEAIDFRGKAVTVVGLARSGVGAANLLSSLGASVTVTDRKGPEELGELTGRLRAGIRLVLGSHPAELFERADIVVISPGVPPGIPPLRAASGKGVRIIGELELAYQAVRRGEEGSPPRAARKTDFLAVTGTNGKSTTSTLLYEMARSSGSQAVLAGNIGDALTEVLFGAEGRKGCGPDSIVVEVSSFQLETIDTFRPAAASILNITPDHMDRYPSMAEYIDAKCRIFLNQGADDFLVLNADDPISREVVAKGGKRWAGGNAPELFFFSRKREVKGAFLKDGRICFNAPGVPSTFNLRPSDFKIRGVHNVENAMAASLMALLAGYGADAVSKTLENFSGLEHRVELVREKGGVKFINDSKGTNVAAVVKSIESFPEPVILIAGGRDKDGDFTELRDLVRDRVKALVLIGEAGEKIRKALGDIRDPFMEEDLGKAVKRAERLASPGDVVLLSPACASFDMFRNFEDRGRQFKKAVMEL